MSKSIFISYVFEDKKSVNTIESWAQQGRLGEVTTVYFDTDIRALGTAVISEAIKKKIEGSAVIFVLIGNDTHNHSWITKEVEYANSYHKKIICIRVPNTTGYVPTILNKCKIIDLDPIAIKNAL